MFKKLNLKLESKTLAVDVVYDIIGSLLYAFGMINFAKSSDFAPGGVSGLAMLINHVTKGMFGFSDGFPIGLATLIINIPVIIFCFKALGLSFFFRSAKTMVISALITDLFIPIIPWEYTGSHMLAAIFGGILAGAGLALVYMRDSSTGGSDFVILAVRKKNPQLSIGVISLAVDGIIILLGGFVYGNVDSSLYGLIMTITYSLIIDKIMYGNDSRKLLTIITTNGQGVSDRIMADIERGVTIMNGKGAFTGADKNVLLCACSKTEVFKIKRIAHDVDEKSFTMVSSIDAAYGEGFKSPNADN